MNCYGSWISVNEAGLRYYQGVMLNLLQVLFRDALLRIDTASEW